MKKSLTIALLAGAMLIGSNVHKASALESDLSWLGEFNPFYFLTYVNYQY